MANQWLRLYSEFAHDPKIQRMSEALQRRFIMLLCIRCSNGEVTLHDDDVTFQLRISNEEWAETKSVFIDKNLIDESNNPVAWDKRQFASDSSAPRVAKYRAKQKEVCNVTVTPQIQNRTDTDTEEKKEQKTSRAPRFDAQAHLVSLSVDDSIAADWLAHRKAKKATVTLTVIDGIKSEAAKARIALSDALAMCCQRGWTGFKAEWVAESVGYQAPAKTQYQINQEATGRALFGDTRKETEPRLIVGEVVS
ncbi:MAG: hypothetical protein WBK19_10430 [Azonexus sp.]